MAHAIRMHATGGPEVLVYEEVEIGDPGPGEARIRQTAIGLNYIDAYHRSGLYPLPMPTSIGSEAAGVVEYVGAGVTWIRRGDRVAYSGGPPGAYATERVVSAERLVKIPDGIDDTTAATLMLKAGIHPKIVSERLGHASIAITLDTYSHVTPDNCLHCWRRWAARPRHSDRRSR